jgi:hypothetical protein
MSYSDRIRQERGLPDVPATDPRIQRLRQMGASIQNISGAEPFEIEPDRRDAEMSYNPARPKDRASPEAMNKLRQAVKAEADTTIEGRLERIEAMLTKLVRKHG